MSNYDIYTQNIYIYIYIYQYILVILYYILIILVISHVWCEITTFYLYKHQLNVLFLRKKQNSTVREKQTEIEKTTFFLK